MKVSFITTVFNEEKTILPFLKSLIKQSKIPDEIIIVDGGSRDATVEKINVFKLKTKKVKIKVITKPGNRSVGRNEAIRQSTGDIILCSDAGNTLDKNWTKHIIKPFSDKKVEVVAGYYKGIAKNIFQQCLIPYVLVMPDKVNPNNFLPATRSVAFVKKIWKKLGGFDESLSHNEDYAFAIKLKAFGANMVFAKDAIVYWQPRNTLKQAFIMFFRFAFGDAESKILRSNVLFLFVRYLLLFYFVFLSILYSSFVPVGILLLSFVLYVIWSIKKNYKYVRDRKAFVILPLLQFTADAAVLSGTTLGLLKRITHFSYISYLKKNKLLFLAIGAYLFIMIVTLQWGIPNPSHPFNYQMDEWHQSQSVRTVFTEGTPNVEGSANGSLLHFLLAGIYLAPFIILGIINPFAIDSSVTSLDIQERLFEIFRLNTLFFGVLSIILLTYIAKKYFKVNKFLNAFLLIFNPLWLSLSNYFKYDIALVFWILLGTLFLFRFIFNPNLRNFIIAGMACSLSFSIKLSAIPLLPVYILVFFLFFPRSFKNISKLFIGVILYIAVFILFGIPDLVFGAGNIYEYLDSNLRRSPAITSNYIFNNYAYFLAFKLYPATFGHAFYLSFFGGVLFFTVLLLKKFFTKKRTTIKVFIANNRAYIFLFMLLLFFYISLLPLKIEGRANRLLVLLPFMVLFISIFFTRIYNMCRTQMQKVLLLSVLFLFAIIQLLETSGWVWMKIAADPRMASSTWIKQHIRQGETIGIEDIPIYQMLPDIVVKEFYYKQYGVNEKNKFKYLIVNSNFSQLPHVVILTNEEVESMYLYKSPKKDLLQRLKKEGYKPVAQFEPDFRIYRLYGDDITFYLASLVIAPNKVTVYMKK